MARSLNRVQLIGNLTRDPELRYTPNGSAVCSFGLATNRSWKTDTGEKHEETEFHNIVSWNKLAELCSQFLVKGRKVYVEGRLSTRTWTTQDGQQKNRTEVVIDDMILLDSAGRRVEQGTPVDTETSAPEEFGEKPQKAQSKKQTPKKKEYASTSSAQSASESSAQSASESSAQSASTRAAQEGKEEDIIPDDIPF